MDLQLVLLSSLRAASAGGAALIAVLAFRAYHATKRRVLLTLALASTTLTVGFLAAGLLYQAAGNLVAATLLEAPFTLGAILLMLGSVFGRDLMHSRRIARVTAHVAEAGQTIPLTSGPER